MLRRLVVLCCVAITLAASAPLVYGMATAEASVPDALKVLNQLFYLYASGNEPIQREAQMLAKIVGLPESAYNDIAALTRATYLSLIEKSPATLGKQGPENKSEAEAALDAMQQSLRGVTGERHDQFIRGLEQAYKKTSDISWVRQNLAPSAPIAGELVGPSASGTYYVWATGFSQTQFPKDFSEHSYVALPDAYLKFANWGYWGSPNFTIPSEYRPYYSNPPYYVHVSRNNRDFYIGWITDVGPWNEDDNWWDSTNSPTTSITPSGGTVWRRVYYYLLYKHNGTYQPTGSFSTSNPPTPLSYSPESEVAMTQNYNNKKGAWCRNNTYANPIQNSAGIDLCPYLENQLGWTYPASGWVFVRMTDLP